MGLKEIVFLSLLAALSISGQCKITVTDIHNLFKEFATLADPGGDTLKQLRLMSTRSVQFLKLIFPAGSLVLEFLEQGLKPAQKEELAAISELSKQLEKHTRTLGSAIQNLEVNLHFKILDNDFNDRVDLPLRRLYQSFDAALRAHNGTSYFSNVMVTCTQWNPNDAIAWLEQKFFIQCKLYGNDDDMIAVYSEAWAAFVRIESRLHLDTSKVYQSGRDNYLEARYEAMLQLTTLSLELAQDCIASLEDELSSAKYQHNNFTSAVIGIRRSLRGLEPSTSCYPETALKHYDFQTAAMLGVLNMLKENLARLELYDIVCNYVRYGRDATKLGEMNENTRVMVSGIASHARRYVTRKLAQIWPDHVITMAQAEMTAAGQSVTYDTTAHNIVKKLDLRGEKGYYYQVVIYTTNGFTTDMWLSVYCYDSVCTKVPDVPAVGMSAVITRFREDQLERCEKAEQWFVENNGNLHYYLRKSRHADNVTELLDEINEHIGGIGDPRLYSSLVVLRDSEFITEPYINSGAAYSAGVDGCSTAKYEHFRFQRYEGLENMELFKLYFFL